MARDLLYRSPNPMLQALLSGADPVGPLPPAPAAQAQPTDDDGGERRRLLDLLSQPEDVGPEPTVDKPNALSLIFSALGDATNAFAAGKAGDSSLKTDAMGEYLANIERQKRDRQRFRERKGQSEFAARQRTAGVLLTEQDRRRDTALRAGEREADRLERAREADARAEQAKAALAQSAAQFAAAQDAAKERERLGREHDVNLATIHEKIRQGDKLATLDNTSISTAKGYIATLASNLDQLVQSPQDIDKLKTNARRFVDQLNVTPEARKVIDAYAAQELNDAFAEKMNQFLAAGSPQPLETSAKKFGVEYDPNAFAQGAGQLPSIQLDPQAGMRLNRRGP